ncbi:cell division topological specificity factor MinE [Ketobacter sp. MCCC 1A13808]|uniref:cell division topological specificity factor MinE n=1 Tax=Ketobacter sp. MCCC 1A13808 TaxID=2602738 RepID=UPI000F1E8FDB|nr:cell division topological specificity factor MinE [Ketobacter sp. MCCC 1A13808]MVF11380.1 cell division topological specificity factor MinE [Ketobacter sp. MCCC 1A13808]RLP54678.1 MAG: cell division topological specificity factor MinE [Ketobacter sp.]
MKFFDYFKSKKKSTASVAKERLQIIVAHERTAKNQPDYLPALQRDLIAVISKYVAISEEMVNVTLDKNDEYAVLELNITLPETEDELAAT